MTWKTDPLPKAPGFYLLKYRLKTNNRIRYAVLENNEFNSIQVINSVMSFDFLPGTVVLGWKEIEDDESTSSSL